MKKILTIFVTLITINPANAQTVALDSEDRDPEYVKTILGRAIKVTDNLKITGTDKGEQVKNIVANKYFHLNDIYEERDSLNKIASSLSGEQKKIAREAADNLKDKKLYRSHFGFDAALSQFLDEKQIEAVKDVMTYNVVNVTYEAQCDMIPTLKEEEKRQILAWLKEAREFAIDAESSKKKHEAFGKYKGRINNYLSKRGYDLTKEREEWAKRVKERGGTL